METIYRFEKFVRRHPVRAGAIAGTAVAFKHILLPGAGLGFTANPAGNEVILGALGVAAAWVLRRRNRTLRNIAVGFSLASFGAAGVELLAGSMNEHRYIPQQIEGIYRDGSRAPSSRVKVAINDGGKRTVLAL